MFIKKKKMINLKLKKSFALKQMVSSLYSKSNDM